MKIVQTLISYGLRQVIGDLADKAIEVVVERFTDESAALPKAVVAANERAWHALHVALAGDSYWEKFKSYALGDATERALRQQIEAVLREIATASKTQPEEVRTASLNDLKRLRRSAAFKPSHLPVAELKRQTAAWKRYTDSKGVIDGAWDAVAGVAAALAEGYPNLSRLLRQRVGDGSPLLAALFSFFLRQEIAKNKELAADLTFDLLGNLYAAQENAFIEVGQALATIGDKIDAILGQLDRIETVVVETQAILLDIQAELHRNNSIDARPLFVEVIARLDRLGMQRGVLSPRHSLSIHSEDERIAVRGLLQQLRHLPAEQQRRVPALLNGLGKLLVGAGDFAEARQTFADAARIAPGDAARAEIHFNDYRSALEQRDWDGALAAIRQAAAFEPARFALFPAHRFTAHRLLGAGGFGAAFLCHDANFDQLVVVKTLHADDLDRNIKDMFNEGVVLRRLHDPAIVAVHDCDFADPVRKERPYIVMDYFPGITLQAHVEKHGPLNPEQYLTVARQIVSGMMAAHQQGVWHRDLKPDNILIQREGERFFIKLIDFGLALRRTVVETSVAQTGAEPTVLGKSAAGTLLFSAPEQLGRLAGVKPGPYSDVYAFGKTSWFTLFQTTEPKRRHLATLPDELVEMLEKCTEHHPKDRYPDFEPVARHINGGTDHKNKTFPANVEPPPPPPSVAEIARLKKQEDDTIHARARQLETASRYAEAIEELEKLSADRRDMAFYYTLCQRREEAAALNEEIAVAADHNQLTWRDRVTITRLKELEPFRKKDLDELLDLCLSEPSKNFTNALGMQFVLAPPATFWMGDRSEQRQVEIPHHLYMGVHPVTQGQWHALMGKNPSYFSRNGGGREEVRGISDADLKLFPVEQVSWEDAQQFIERLNARERDREWLYRLPTEAEWEYICRGGATSQADCSFDFYFDEPTNSASSHQANFDGNHPTGNGAKGPYLERPTRVGSYDPNRLGVFDMHGNVWELCHDAFEGASVLVIRGGGWHFHGESCRASHRSRSAPTRRDFYLGLRLARVPSGQ